MRAGELATDGSLSYRPPFPDQSIRDHLNWQQRDAVRIVYIHVTVARLASAGYLALVAGSFCSLVSRHPQADLSAAEIDPAGAGFTGLCLATGSLCGKRMRGASRVRDARLTSVLVLFFF